MPRHAALSLAPLIAVVLAGCPPSKGVVLHGESEQVRLEKFAPEALGEDQPSGTEHKPWHDTFAGDGLILEGTVVCLTPHHATAGEVSAVLEEPLDIMGECYEETVSGAVQTVLGQERCYEFGDGQANWTYSLGDCPDHPEPEALASDLVIAQGVAADAVTAAFVPWPEAGASSLSMSITGDTLPRDIFAPYGDELRLVAGSDVRLYASLFGPEDEHVLWHSPDAEMTLAGGGEVADGTYAQLGLNGAHTDLDDGAWLRVNLEAGATAEAAVALGDDSWELATLVGVDASEAATLDVIAIALEEGTAPFAARAYARDAQGRLLHGAPVEWSIDFGGVALAMASGTSATEVWAGPDYLTISDTCQAPSMREGRRRATLRATLGDLVATVPMEWTEEPAEDGEDNSWVRPEECVTPGCSGCASAPSETAGLWALLPALVLVRRRRAPTV